MKTKDKGLVLSMIVLLASAIPSHARAEPTREVRVAGPKPILEGDPETSSVDAQGWITMGPSLVALGKPSEKPITCLALGDAGAILAGTAGGGVLRLSGTGESKLLTRAEDKIVSHILVAAGATYVATNPDGKVSFLNKDGSLKTVYDGAAKYVWSMLADGGDILVGTGEPGQIVRVPASGSGAPKVLFDPGETHVRAMLHHPARGLIAGGGQKGIVYQVGPSGVFALYDSELEEVTALALDPSTGDIYAALVSESKSGALVSEKSIGSVSGEPTESEGSPIKGSDVVRIAENGRVDLVWTSKREGALGLAFDAKAKMLSIATGAGGKGRGRIYAVDTRARDRLLLLARTDAPVASAVLAPATGGGIVVGTSPAGQVLRLGPTLRSDAAYVSAEQDLYSISRIGRVWFDADVPNGAKVEVSVRSGNTKEHDKTWSSWSEPVEVTEGRGIRVPEGRFIQFRARLISGNATAVPVVKSLHASVVRMNVAPTVDEVFALRRGVYMAKIPPEDDHEKTITLSRSALSNLRDGDDGDNEPATRVRQGERTGMATVAWRASDSNGDSLIYRVELGSEGRESTWRVVADGLTEPFFSFDTRAYRDGRYRARVTASDRPSNPPDRALSDRNLSEPFVIDNTPPRIKALKATSPGAGRIRVEAEAEDETSMLEVAEVAIDGGPWLMLPASDGLLDDRREALAVDFGGNDTPGSPPLKAGNHSVLVRIEDGAGNAASASTTIVTR